MFSNMNHFHHLNSMEGPFNPSFHGIIPLTSDKLPGYHQPHLALTCLFNDEVQIHVGQSSLPSFDPASHFSNLMNEAEIVEKSFSLVSRMGFDGPSKVHKPHQVQNYCGKKRKRMGEEEIEKPREVVHVRAERGQATDSHSLSERLRREKINEKLRCLQDLVPGCYKTMGMAVMLDVIINYVRSLQNQIDPVYFTISTLQRQKPWKKCMEVLVCTRLHKVRIELMEKVMEEGFRVTFNHLGLFDHLQLNSPNQWSNLLLGIIFTCISRMNRRPLSQLCLISYFLVVTIPLVCMILRKNLHDM